MRDQDRVLLKKQLNRLSLLLITYTASMFIGVILYILFKIIMDESNQSVDQIIAQLSKDTLASGSASLIGIGLTFIVINMFYRKELQKISFTVKEKKMHWTIFGKLFLCFMGIQGIFSVVSLIVEHLANKLGYTFIGDIEMATSTSTTVSMFIYAAIIGPIMEELVFRGIILKSLVTFSKLYGILLSSVLFGIFHGNYLQGIFAALVGIILSYVTIEYSIIWAIVLHIINNGLFGDALNRVLQIMPTEQQNWIMMLIQSAFFIGGCIVLVKHWQGICQYIRQNKSPQGIYRVSLKAFWLWVVVLINLWIGLGGIQPL